MNRINLMFDQCTLHVPVHYSVTVRGLLTLWMRVFVLQYYLLNDIAAYLSDQVVEIVWGVTSVLWQPEAYVIRARRIYADGLKQFSMLNKLLRDEISGLQYTQ